jgi:hypothetical protein
MGKSGKKPRKKMDVRQAYGESSPKAKKDKDWSFEEIARSKPYRR